MVPLDWCMVRASIRLFNVGVLGFSVMSLDFGDIERTTYENPRTHT